MRIRAALVSVAGLVLMACQGDQGAVIPKQTAPGTASERQLASMAHVLNSENPLGLRRQTSVKEDSLIEALVAHYPGPRGELMRSVLLDPYAQLRRVESAPPDVEQVEDQIDSIRQARHDSIVTAHMATAPYPATVALVPRLRVPDTAATAVILRRVSGKPQDVILLDAGRASPGVYAAAVRALLTLRARDGDVPTRNAAVAVHDTAMPSAWERAGLDKRAVADFQQLKTQAPRRLDGVGTVPSLTIELAPMKKRRQ
jgi:hypothetical protein